jgi:hypothetical protein
MLYSSITDVVLNPIVNAATEFISSTRLPAVHAGRPKGWFERYG